MTSVFVSLYCDTSTGVQYEAYLLEYSEDWSTGTRMHTIPQGTQPFSYNVLQVPGSSTLYIVQYI